MNYQYALDANNQNRQDVILRIKDDGVISWVPNDPKNSDWQAYQAWLLLGNETLPG